VTNVTADGNVATVVPTVAGSYDYTYSVWDDYGCFNDSTITITIDDLITVSAGLDTSICNGQPVVLGDTGAGGGVGCNYSLDLVDTFGDSWNGNSIDVTINGVNTNYSPGGSGQTVALNVNHGDVVTLQWNATGNWQSENEIYLYDGDGNLVYSNGVGGTPSTTMGSVTVDCYGGLTFVWTPDNGSLSDINSPSPTVTNPAATTVYTLAVYPNGHPGCVTYDDVTVSIGGGLDAGLDSVVTICKEAVEQDLFQYIGGNPQLDGVWFSPIGDTIVMPVLPDTLVDGLYEYKRDSAGCFVSAFVDVTISEITLSALINHSDCNAYNGEVKLIASPNALNPIAYSNDAGVTSTLNDLFLQGYNGGILGGMGGFNLYSFQITDGNGCVASIDSIVIDDNFPEIDINSILLVGSDCDADNGQVTDVVVNGGSPNYEFSTDNGANYYPLGLVDLTPNNFDLIARDMFGCTDTVQITIDEINIPEITSFIPTDVTCYTAGDGTIDVSGNNLMSYSIDGGATFQATGLFQNLVPGDYVITAYSGPNATLCNVATGQVTIDEPDALDIDTLSNGINSFFTNDLVVCSGDEITLGVQGFGGNGNYTYDWDNVGTSLGQGTTLTTIVTNDMEICVTMSEDCPSPTDTECMNVVISENIYPAITSDLVDGCYPLTVTLTNESNNPLSILNSTWIFSDDNVSNNVVGSSGITHTFQDPGLYDLYLSLVSSEGCIYDTTFTQHYDVYDHPEANYTYSTIPLTVYDSEANFTDYSTGNPLQWAWDFGVGATPLTSTLQNPVVEYPEGVAAIYPTSLQVWNEFGCFDVLEGQVEVINDVTCFAPNIFTPDGDEYNETWRVYISGIDIYDYHVTMFNRWGEVVWESYDATAEWDGSYASDGTIQDGSYVWILHAKDSYNDKKYEFNGTVSIAR
jgi:gliding motility-associated-like protein